MTTNADRSHLARQMLATLPMFGNWAISFRDFDTPYGHVGYRQASILWILHHDSPTADQTPFRLAERFMVQPSVITGALAKLEAAGFITRSADPDDSRIARIAITENGRLVSEYVEAFFANDIYECLGEIDEEEVVALQQSIDALDRIGKSLLARRVQKLTRRGRSARDPRADATAHE